MITTRRRRESVRSPEDVSWLTRFMNRYLGSYGNIFGLSILDWSKILILFLLIWSGFIHEQRNRFLAMKPAALGLDDETFKTKLDAYIEPGQNLWQDFLFPWKQCKLSIFGFVIDGFNIISVYFLTHLMLIMAWVSALTMQFFRNLRHMFRIYLVLITMGSVISYIVFLHKYRPFYVILFFILARIAIDLALGIVAWSLQIIIAVGGYGSEKKSYQTLFKEDEELMQRIRGSTPEEDQDDSNYSSSKYDTV